MDRLSRTRGNDKWVTQVINLDDLEKIRCSMQFLWPKRLKLITKRQTIRHALRCKDLWRRKQSQQQIVIPLFLSCSAAAISRFIRSASVWKKQEKTVRESRFCYMLGANNKSSKREDNLTSVIWISSFQKKKMDFMSYFSTFRWSSIRSIKLVITIA